MAVSFILWYSLTFESLLQVLTKHTLNTFLVKEKSVKNNYSLYRFFSVISFTSTSILCAAI